MPIGNHERYLREEIMQSTPSSVKDQTCLAKFMKRGALVLFAGWLITGCVPGTVESIGTTIYLYEKDLDAQHKGEVEKIVQRYVDDLANTPCNQNDLKPVEPAVDLIKDHRYTGTKKVLKMLEEIESDNNNRDAVKASSLYYQAVIYAMKKDPNKILATERLKTLHKKYPDEFQCLFQESEWRDQMMEKYLLEEGQKVEDYVQKFKKALEDDA